MGQWWNNKYAQFFSLPIRPFMLSSWIVWLFDLLSIPKESSWSENITNLDRKRDKVLDHHHSEEAKKQKANNKRKLKELFSQSSQSDATYGLSCKCISGCNTSSCPCNKKNTACSTSCACINCSNIQSQSSTTNQPKKKKKIIHHIGSDKPTTRKKKCCCYCGNYFTQLEQCPNCLIEVCELCNSAPMCKCCVTNTQIEEEDRKRKKK